MTGSSTGLEWFKSSYSGSDGGNCLEVAYTWRKSSHSGSEPGSEYVEVAYPWRKSSHSGSDGGECVEVATHPAAVHVRDSKNPDGPRFSVAPAAWTAFLALARDGA